MAPDGAGATPPPPRHQGCESGRVRGWKTGRDAATRLRSSAPTERRGHLLAVSYDAHAAAARRRLSAIQRSRSDSARALMACFFAKVFSLPRSRVPSAFRVGGGASGGESPEIEVIGC